MKRRTLFATALIAGLGLSFQAQAATQWEDRKSVV